MTTVIKHAKFNVILNYKTNKQIFMILHNENLKQVFSHGNTC